MFLSTHSPLNFLSLTLILAPIINCYHQLVFKDRYKFGALSPEDELYNKWFKKMPQV